MRLPSGFVKRLRRACRAYAQKYVDLQSASFQRLGIFGRWEKPYLTMAPEYQAVIAGAFVDFFEKGYVYRALKLVNWCINDFEWARSSTGRATDS